MPTVSAIIPTFNRAALLVEAVESALAQRRPPDEILVIDDGSRDDTAARMAAYGERVRYVRQANAGPSAARNHGFRLARGEFLALLDSDDLWTPDRLERQLDVLQRHPETDVVFGREVLFGAGQPDRDWNLHDPEVRRALLETNGPLAGASALLIRENMVPTSTALFRRTLLERAGFIDESLRQAEDWDLWLRFAFAGARFAHVPAPLCRRRMHDSNLIHDKGARMQATLAVLERHLPQLGDWRAAAELRCSELAYDLGSLRFRERSFSEAARLLARVRPGTRRPFVLALKLRVARLLSGGAAVGAQREDQSPPVS
jgi:glycosyltransferase involved in cell wall biosynthesis